MKELTSVKNVQIIEILGPISTTKHKKIIPDSCTAVTVPRAGWYTFDYWLSPHLRFCNKIATNEIIPTMKILKTGLQVK